MNAAAAATQKTRITVYKIVVLGDGGVGKSGMSVCFQWSINVCVLFLFMPHSCVLN